MRRAKKGRKKIVSLQVGFPTDAYNVRRNGFIWNTFLIYLPESRTQGCQELVLGCQRIVATKGLSSLELKVKALRRPEHHPEQYDLEKP